MTIRVMSGGQSGVDRAALDFALAHGIDYGGWCPKGGWAEDLPEPPGLLARYPLLQETPSHDPRQRTEWNVRDADATLVLCGSGIESPGTDFTIACARKYSKPALIVALESNDAAAQIDAWLQAQGNLTGLNIAGPREAEAPGIYDAVTALLLALFSSINNSRDAGSS